jgi:tetratricopeptide (TPR) repeat protein
MNDAPPSSIGDRHGRIVTFYSYKGGTGRSMALANVAWVLASNDQRVLVIDWDLEAPGLHRYFAPFLPDPNLTSSPGVIDMVWDVVDAADSDGGDDPPSRLNQIEIEVFRYVVSLRGRFAGRGRLDFLPAGRQGPGYAARVRGFDWTHFYEDYAGRDVLARFRERLRRQYDFVLIDSRTGVSDTAGISTVEFPDDLVACFTLNQQSVLGAHAAAESARDQRLAEWKTSGARTPLRVFPVPCRIDAAEKVRLERGRRIAHDLFAPFLDHLDARERGAYWGAVELPYQAFFAYEELLAVFADRSEQVLSLLASYQRLTSYLTNGRITGLGPLDDELREAVMRDFHGKEVPEVERPDESFADRMNRLQVRERLRVTSAAWHAAGRPASRLPGGALLDYLSQGLAKESSPDERLFLEAARRSRLRSRALRYGGGLGVLLSLAVLVGLLKRSETEGARALADSQVRAARALAATQKSEEALSESKLAAEQLRARISGFASEVTTLAVLNDTALRDANQSIPRLSEDEASIRRDLEALKRRADELRQVEVASSVTELEKRLSEASGSLADARRRLSTGAPPDAGVPEESVKSDAATKAWRLGYAAMQANKLPEAEAHYRESLKLDPKNAAAQNSLGVVAMSRGDNAAATDAFKKAIAIDGKYWAPHFNLGLLAKRRGDLGVAREHFVEALQRRPNDPGITGELDAIDATMRVQQAPLNEKGGGSFKKL